MLETAAAAPLRLQLWLSPGFPTGAFAWSHGLEAAVAEGRLGSAAETRDWLAFLLARGSGWNDLVLFAEGYRAAADPARLVETVDLARALAGSRERRAEILALGEAFALAVAPWDAAIPGDAPYPIAVALAAARSGIPLGQALVAFAGAFAANLVSAAVRLVPLGQTGATLILRELEPAILAAAARAAASSPYDLGSAATLSDIAAMRHETLRTRLFRS
ncbi:urease accessory protein UreF [Aureimonas leprariae]|uniref:Urease accessory protein UreF n=1 Tax=Plantimonas leprariae TaxID=2615207 RepID=A0A7V7PNL2_9HYPH|nr:urease accessory UreF family protein [Aureimonas leprariae]KAB0679285.1 urease accessory protein UreF [Aureimonas leprariae]